MYGIVLVGHGKLPEEFQKFAEHLTGETVAGIAAVSVDPDLSPGQTEIKIDAAIRLVDEGQGVVVLSDLLGATPQRMCCRCQSDSEVEFVTGMNLAMLVSLLETRKSMNPKQSTEIAIMKSKAGIVGCSPKQQTNTKRDGSIDQAASDFSPQPTDPPINSAALAGSGP